ILATSCLFGATTWIIFLSFSAPEERRRLLRVAGDIIIAGTIMAILAAPFLFYIFKGSAEVPSSIHPPEALSADLLNYLVPTEVTRLGSNFFPEIARRFPLNLSEQGAYLGLPLILILVIQFLDMKRRPYLKPLLISLLVPLLLSLGPSLHVAGVRMDFWLPWRLGLHLPLIRQAIPARFPMYVALAAALATALWLAAANPGRDRARRFSLAALACVFLVPNPARVAHWTPLAQVRFFQPQNVVSTLGRDANVILLPYGQTGPGLIWQVASGMAFTQSGGYVGFTPQAELSWRVFYDLADGLGGSSVENDISALCATHRVSAILIGPGTPAPLAAAVEALHWPEAQDHEVRIVRVPDLRNLHFYYVSGDYWPTEPANNWMGHQIKIVTHGQSVRLGITGRGRPPELGPEEFRVVYGSQDSRYSIGAQDTQVLTLPADASVLLMANATYIPDRFIHNGDDRHLSAIINLQPEAGAQ
ncbi:MAG: hypothetical protein JO313_04890, partial [Verrucomicrobia bacterium]|nr:hypothetical protein [Verrucomicrobiota bacterium]